MKALVWKELRENFKWALLAMVILAGAEYYALTYSEYGSPDYYYNYGVTICRQIFLTVTSFGCIAVGLLLGLIQILPELKRDQWAALLHRPVPRGMIFRGKILAGLLLYLTATGLPFFFFTLLVATPGHFSAPFVPGMMKPGVADIFTGAIYYFAAFSLGLQRGGWVGLRLLPLFAAVHATYFIQANKLFYVAVEAAILMAIALAFAAWGSLHDQDRLKSRPWLGKLAFLIVIFYGICGLGDLSKSLIDTLVPDPPFTYQRYVLSTEGVPLLLTYTSDIVVSVKDPDGREMTDPKYKPDRVRNNVNYLNSFSNYIGDSHGWKESRWQPSYRESYSYLGTNSPYMYPRYEQWFELREDHSYIGYLPREKKAFARLDSRGFQPLSAVPVGFSPETETGSGGGGENWFIAEGSRLRFASLPKREITEVPLPKPGPIYGMGEASARNEEQPVVVTGVTLKDGLAIYDSKAKLMTVLPYHRDMDRWGDLQMGVNGAGNRFYLLYSPSVWIDGKTRKTMPSFVEEMDLAGKVIHDYTLAPLPDFSRSPDLNAILASGLKTPAFFFGLMGYQKIGAELGSKRLAGDLAWKLGAGWKDTRETAIRISVLSVILALITYFWAKRGFFTGKQALGWSVFVLFFNFAGLLVFRLAADWPVAVACADCPANRPVELENCPHCGKAWPGPGRDGSEIFDYSEGTAAVRPV